MPCTDYQRHEFWCDHRDKAYRWRTNDGCSGTCCLTCWAQDASPRTWPDLLAVTAIDDDGIPLNQRDWTEADAIGNLLRQIRPA